MQITFCYAEANSEATETRSQLVTAIIQPLVSVIAMLSILQRI